MAENCLPCPQKLSLPNKDKPLYITTPRSAVASRRQLNQHDMQRLHKQSSALSVLLVRVMRGPQHCCSRSWCDWAGLPCMLCCVEDNICYISQPCQSVSCSHQSHQHVKNNRH